MDACVTEFVRTAPMATWIDQLREVAPDARIVVLTRRLRRTELAALCATADAVVPKTAPADLTLQAVEGRCSGLVHPPEPVAEVPAVPPHADLSSLTPREHEVLTELANGLSTGRIADELGVATTTARTYIQSILTKLGVHSKVQAVALAFALDLVGPPDLTAQPLASSTGMSGTARVA